MFLASWWWIICKMWTPMFQQFWWKRPSWLTTPKSQISTVLPSKPGGSDAHWFRKLIPRPSGWELPRILRPHQDGRSIKSVITRNAFPTIKKMVLQFPIIIFILYVCHFRHDPTGGYSILGFVSEKSSKGPKWVSALGALEGLLFHPVQNMQWAKKGQNVGPLAHGVFSAWKCCFFLYFWLDVGWGHNIHTPCYAIAFLYATDTQMEAAGRCWKSMCSKYWSTSHPAEAVHKSFEYVPTVRNLNRHFFGRGA